MIPKKIHYCWFGNKEKPDFIKKCIATWSKLEGYEIIEWNETNIDINENKYIKDNYQLKKYAFVSDYVRLKVLYEHGGIYLDTDIEVFKNFKEEFLENKMFLCFMFDCNLSTAIIGAEKNNSTIKELLDIYTTYQNNTSPNNDLFTRFILENYKDFRLNNKYQKLDNGNITIYPKEYFECPTKVKEKGYSMHHLDNSWIEKSLLRKVVKKCIKVIRGNRHYHINMRKRAIKKSPFYDIYIKHNSI